MCAASAACLPVSISIIILLTIVYFSYRQTIEAYPGGGGSYTVARENIGPFAGLLAAAALMIDYVLTAAVGISAGVGALASAAPSLLPHTLVICLGILVMITLVNLRGVRDTGVVFMVPTYMFVGCLLLTILIGVSKTLATHGHPMPVIPPPHMPAAVTAVSAWLLLQVFSSGCTAMTGVEAVSNGVKAFREPTAPTAQKTLTIIIAILIVLLAGIAYLVSAYQIGATDPGAPGYQSVLSMLLMAVTGRGIFYYVSIGAILLVLALSANTAFADFPRLCRIIAHDGYLPHSFVSVGRRLVYSQGIYVLAVLTAVLLILFRGVTDRLIPLYAVGAFLAFTLSQAGMVMHWKRHKGGLHHILVNGLGAIATGITVIVVLVAKFVEGAWITMLLIPVLLVIMGMVKGHYRRVARETASREPVDLTHLLAPMVVVPIQDWNKVTQKALQFAYTLTKEVHALHVEAEEETTSTFCKDWDIYAEKPALKAGLPPPELVVVTSPYRWILRPIIEYVLKAEKDNPDRQIAVVIPEMVERRWYHHLLHNKRAGLLKTLLLLRGSQRIIVINVPWYLKN